MTGPARYAAYFAPEAGSALAEFGRIWLGRRAGDDDFDALPENRAAVVAEARFYGFHATLKPPFRLSAGQGEHDVFERMECVAAQSAAFQEPPLILADLNGFLALRPALQSQKINDLADNCLRGLDILRAPAAAAETAKRKSAGLSGRQTELLEMWGYPYVLDQYRFHMTLTGKLDENLRAGLRGEIADLHKAAAGEPTEFRSIALFRQIAPDRPFVQIERFVLRGAS